MLKNLMQKTIRGGAVAMLLTPLAGFAAATSIYSTRSATYHMGIVPYYVYGYDVKINTASALNALKQPPVAPKLPVAGSGGKTRLKTAK